MSSMDVQPFKINRFDDEAQSRVDRGYVFIHDALNNCGFARIVKATAFVSTPWQKRRFSDQLTASERASPSP